MESLLNTVVDALDLPWIRNSLWAIALLIVTAVVSNFATRALRRLLQRDNNPLPNASIFMNIVRAAVWLLGGSIVLDSCFNINASGIIAALGVGGIAISLGFQDTLANLIGGLQVTFMGIVKPGDNIEVGTETGVVQDVSWRHTTIKDSLGQTVIIPNSIISKTALVHLLPATRVAVPFAVSRQAFERSRTMSGNEFAMTNQPIDRLSATLRDLSRAAIEPICPIADGPRVVFSEVAEFGVKGKIILTVADASYVPAATDAVVRAIASELQ